MGRSSESEIALGVIFFSDFDFGKCAQGYIFFKKSQKVRSGLYFFQKISESALGLYFFQISILESALRVTFFQILKIRKMMGRRVGSVNRNQMQIFVCVNRRFFRKFIFFSELCHFPELLWIFFIFFSKRI